MNRMIQLQLLYRINEQIDKLNPKYAKDIIFGLEIAKHIIVNTNDKVRKNE